MMSWHENPLNFEMLEAVRVRFYFSDDAITLVLIVSIG